MLFQAAIAFMAGILLLLMLTIELGFGPVRQQVLQPENIRSDKGFCYTVDVRLDRFTASQENHLPMLSLTEDGKELKPLHQIHYDIRMKGNGLSSLWGKTLYFSTSDNTDPRSNGRTYVLSWKSKPASWQWMLISSIFLLSLMGLIGNKVKAIPATIHQANPVVLILIVGFWCAVYMLVLKLFILPDVFELIVDGVPVSDGLGWYSLSHGFSEGYRNSYHQVWDARRPLTYWFYGSIFLLTGASVYVVYIINLLLAVVGAMLFFDTLRRLSKNQFFSLIASLGASSVYYSAGMTFTTGSESLGVFLTLLGLWCWTMAFTRAGVGKDFVLSKNVCMYAFLTGVFIMLSNMARPLSLLACVPLALAYFWINFRWKRGSWEKWHPIIPVTLFAIGAAITVTPWLVRQQLKYGFIGLSDNSSEMLYAAVSKDHGEWSGEISAMFGTYIKENDLKNQDLGDRYKFYNNLTKEEFSRNPNFFFHNAWKHSKRAYSNVVRVEWLLITGFFFTILGLHLLLSKQWKLAFVLLLLAGLLVVFHEELVHVLLFTAIAYFLLKRDPMLIIAALWVGSLILCGLTAASFHRLTYAIIPVTDAILVWAIFYGTSILVKQFNAPMQECFQSRKLEAYGAFGKYSRKAGLIVMGVFSLLASIGFAYNASGVVDIQKDQLTDNESRILIMSEIEQIRSEQTYKHVRFTPGTSLFLEKGQAANHWLEQYRKMSFDRTVLPMVYNGRYLYAVIPGNWEPVNYDRQYIVVGTLNHAPREFLIKTVYMLKENQKTLDSIVYDVAKAGK